MASKFHNRYRVESVRKKGFDYSREGSYFVTVCTKNKQHLFGKVIRDNNNDQEANSKKMILSEYGKILQECWNDLPDHYPYIRLDAFVIMPDHIHGVIHINNTPDLIEHHCLSEFIRALKSFSSRRISELRMSKKPTIWQSGYYDHIITGQDELINIRKYIIANPDKWDCQVIEIPDKQP